MKAIIGLGNPGQKYANTRHNLGFMVVDELVRQFEAGTPRDRFKSQIWETRINDERIALVKPQTYMNLSGVSVQQVKNWYKLGNEEMLIIYDDVDLEFGTLRLRLDGSAGGHNGLSSIIDSLGANDVPRLRIGIGRGGSATTAHVLSRIPESEEPQRVEMIHKAAQAATLWATDGPTVAMNRVNRRPNPEKPSKDGQGESLPVTPNQDQHEEST